MTFYETTTRVAHVGATVAALIVAFGASMGFYHMTGNYYVAILTGVGIAAGLALSWYILITLASRARRGASRAAIATFGALLVAVAIGTSGWALATAIGGKAALASYQARALAEHEIALADATSRVNEQLSLVDFVHQTAAATRAKADEESRTGRGPNYRGMMDTSERLDRAAGDMQDEIDRAGTTRAAGLAALDRADRALGDAEPFRLALADVTAAIVELNAIDVSPEVMSIGMVGLNDRGLPELSDLDQNLRDRADNAVGQTIAVPRYISVNRADATLSEFPMGAWIAATAIDVMPFLLMLLVMVASTEPLLREQRKGRTRVSDDEIRTNEEELNGPRLVAGE